MRIADLSPLLLRQHPCSCDFWLPHGEHSPIAHYCTLKWDSKCTKTEDFDAKISKNCLGRGIAPFSDAAASGKGHPIPMHHCLMAFGHLTFSALLWQLTHWSWAYFFELLSRI